MVDKIKIKALKDISKAMDDKDFLNGFAKNKNALMKTEFGKDLVPIFDKIVNREGLTDIEIFAFAYCMKAAEIKDLTTRLKKDSHLLLCHKSKRNNAMVNGNRHRKTETDPIDDRRSGADRRIFSYTEYSPERRSEKN